MNDSNSSPGLPIRAVLWGFVAGLPVGIILGWQNSVGFGEDLRQILRQREAGSDEKRQHDELGDAVGFGLLQGLLEDDGGFVGEQGRVDLVRM